MEHGGDVLNQPHVIVLHVGTNDLDCSVLHRDIQNYEQMIRLAHDRFPKATILLNSILPRFDDEVLSHKGHIVNIHLAQLCKKLNCNVRFVDCINMCGTFTYGYILLILYYIKLCVNILLFNFFYLAIKYTHIGENHD